jgi:thioredoxin-like negative regulator of GroEL
MWQNNLCEGAEIANNLAQSSPEKIEYLLLAAKINFWLEKDFTYAQSLYEKVLAKDPKNTEAMFGFANLYIRDKNIDGAEKLIHEISIIDSTSNDFYLLNNNFNTAKIQKKIDELNLVLDEARNFSVRKDYYYAVKSFNKYLAGDPNNKSVKLELADVYLANSDFNSAIKIYDDILKVESDYDIEKQRAKVHLWKSDSLTALREFIQLNQKNPADIETKLYLGDAYLQSGQLQNARIIYEDLLVKSPDSHILKTRLGWLGGSEKFSFDRFPTYIQLIPRALYFTDNTDFNYANFGLGFDLGITNVFAFGVSGSRGKLSSESEDVRFTQIKGTAYVKFNDILSGSAGFGKTFFANDLKENIIEFSLSAQRKNLFNITAFLNYSDAAFILYSPFLVSARLNAYHSGLNGEYRFKNDLIVSAKYSYLNVSDDKTGNQFQARLGKVFESDITAGYEYFFYTFDTQSLLYWSPSNFESHSIWANWILYKDEVVDFTIGGKLGLIPQNDYLISEFNAAFNYQILNSLFLQIRYLTGSSFRSNTGYRSNSIQASFIWNL